MGKNNPYKGPKHGAENGARTGNSRWNERSASAKTQETDGSNRRLSRVEREIREVVARFLLGGFTGDLQSLVSVTRVIVSGDLRQAKVLVTMMPKDPEGKLDLKQELQELAHGAYEIQGEIARQLKMRQTPRLTFHFDDSFAHAMRIENLLHDISKQRVEQETPPQKTNGDEE